MEEYTDSVKDIFGGVDVEGSTITSCDILLVVTIREELRISFFVMTEDEVVLKNVSLATATLVLLTGVDVERGVGNDVEGVPGSL